MKFDASRDLSEGYSEPGDHPEAPYHEQHLFATKIEKMVAEKLGVNWEEYEKEIHQVMQDA